MSSLLEVAFKGNRREFFLWEGDLPPGQGAPVVVEADLNLEEFAKLIANPEEESRQLSREATTAEDK